MSVRVGTSGWSYPTGQGTWNGVFYPARRPRGFDELAYYAAHFDTVEINSTFYRVPEADTSRAWVRRTPPEFEFSVKLYQKFTHPEMYLKRPGVAQWDVSAIDLDMFKRGVEPLAEAGRLMALLIQFPSSFHAGPDSGAYLDWLTEAFAGYPIAVELRHRSWNDAGRETRARLDAARAAWVQIDEPRHASSMKSDEPRHASSGDHDGLRTSSSGQANAPTLASPPLAYFRFHGRNAAAWWTHEAAEDRYNYLYSTEELRPFVEQAKASAAVGRRTVMYFNNHFSAKAVANAAVLKHQLGDRVPGEYPSAMVRRYPDLVGIVATSGLPL